MVVDPKNPDLIVSRHTALVSPYPEFLNEVMEKLRPRMVGMKQPRIWYEDDLESDNILIHVEEGYRYNPSDEEIAAAVQVLRDSFPLGWSVTASDEVHNIVREMLCAADAKRVVV